MTPRVRVPCRYSVEPASSAHATGDGHTHDPPVQTQLVDTLVVAPVPSQVG